MSSGFGLIQKHVAVLTSKVGDGKEILEKKSKKLIQIEAKIENNITKIEKDIEFYEKNDNCPTCKQSIETHFKEQQIEERKSKVGVQQKGLEEVKAEIDKISNRLKDIAGVLNHINAHNGEIIKHNSTISAIQQYITKLNGEINNLSTTKDNLGTIANTSHDR